MYNAGLLLILFGFLLAGWSAYRSTNLNRCPSCRTRFGLRSQAEVMAEHRQEHYQASSLSRHPYDPPPKHIGHTVSRYLCLHVTCANCDFYRQDKLTEEDSDSYDNLAGTNLPLKLMYWLVIFMLPIAFVSGAVGIAGATIGAAIGVPLSIVFSIFYFRIIFRDQITRRVKWRLTFTATIALGIGAGMAGVTQGGNVSTAAHGTHETNQEVAEKKAPEKGSTSNPDKKEVEGKAIAKDGKLVLRTRIAVVAGVDAWVEVNNIRVASWPVGSKEVTVTCPAGMHRVSVLSIYLGRRTTIFDRQVQIAPDKTQVVDVGS